MKNIGTYKKGPFGSALTKSIFVPKGENTIKVYEQKNAIYKDVNLGDYYISFDYFENKMKGFEIFPQDIIVSCAGTIGETYIMPDKFERGIINQALMKMRISTHIYPAYFLLYFDYVLKKYSIDKSKGSAIKNIPPFEIFKEYFFPIPPINEQREIVKKIEKINPLITNYETSSNELNTLNCSYKVELKKSILQYAIQGKLVLQNSDDESAKVLINKILEEKRKLIKEKQVKKENLSVIYKDDTDNQFYEKFDDGTIINITDEIPFDIPQNWVWTRLGILCKDIHYGYTASAQSTGNAKLLRITDIQENNVNWCTVPFCEVTEKDQKQYTLKNRDILIARTGGTIGKTYIVKNLQELSVFASYLIRCIPSERINEEYIKKFMESPFYWKQLKEKSQGTGQPNVNATSLKALLIPVPSLEHQKEIVKKLEKIFENL